MNKDILYKVQTRFLFHTHIKVKVSAFYEDSIFDDLFQVLEDVDIKYNSYQPNSYIDQINKNAGAYIDVDNETISILNNVISLSDLFEGEYDITIMPLIRLWGFYKDRMAVMPTKLDIEQTRKFVDYRNIDIKENKVRIDQGQEIITGSFIKAYAIDRLRGKMLQLGINDAVVNAGGSTILAMNNNIHPSWQVAVRKSDDNSLLFNLNIGNCCYSTSSQANSFVEIDGYRYGHILSPLSGMPSANKHVGIISDGCMVGDIISTGLYNCTSSQFNSKMAMLKTEFSNLEGFLIDKDGAITFTEGFSQFIT